MYKIPPKIKLLKLNYKLKDSQPKETSCLDKLVSQRVSNQRLHVLFQGQCLPLIKTRENLKIIATLKCKIEMIKCKNYLLFVSVLCRKKIEERKINFNKMVSQGASNQQLCIPLFQLKLDMPADSIKNLDLIIIIEKVGILTK